MYSGSILISVPSRCHGHRRSLLATTKLHVTTSGLSTKSFTPSTIQLWLSWKVGLTYLACTLQCSHFTHKFMQLAVTCTVSCPLKITFWLCKQPGFLSHEICSSPSFSVSVSLCLCVSLSLCLSVCHVLSVSVCLSLCVSLPLSQSLSLFLFKLAYLLNLKAQKTTYVCHMIYLSLSLDAQSLMNDQCFHLFNFRWPWHCPGFLWVLPGHLPPAAFGPNAVVCVCLEWQWQGKSHFKRGWYVPLAFVFCHTTNNRLLLYSAIFWPTQNHCALQHFPTFLNVKWEHVQECNTYNNDSSQSCLFIPRKIMSVCCLRSSKIQERK